MKEKRRKEGNDAKDGRKEGFFFFFFNKQYKEEKGACVTYE